MNTKTVTGFVQAVQFSPGAAYFREINLTVVPEGDPIVEGTTYILDGSDTTGGAWAFAEGPSTRHLTNWGLTLYLSSTRHRVKATLQVPVGGYDHVVRGGTFEEENPPRP